MIYLVVFISWFAHVLSKIYDQIRKRKSEFKPLVWIKDPINYLYVIISFLTALTLVLSINFADLKDLVVYGITFKIAYLFAIVIGWTSASIIRAILKKFKNAK